MTSRATLGRSLQAASKASLIAAITSGPNAPGCMNERMGKPPSLDPVPACHRGFRLRSIKAEEPPGVPDGSKLGLPARIATINPDVCSDSDAEVRQEKERGVGSWQHDRHASSFASAWTTYWGPADHAPVSSTR
jgi:hypothetical protein